VAAAEPGERAPYGRGVFRRRIRLAARGERVRAELEDDFHRFAVELRHDGRRVVEARGEALRFPWTACAGATARIEALAGAPLVARAVDLAARTDATLHCTHLHDLAALALAHAAAGRARREYAVAVPDRIGGATRPSLARDGEPLFVWEVAGDCIAGPAPFAGVPLRGRAFIDWIAAELDPDGAEAAWVLRRALFIALGRAGDLDAVPTAAAVTAMVGAPCHSFQPAIAPRARRVVGSTREWTDDPDGPLGGRV
jgi:hypothetical protein